MRDIRNDVGILSETMKGVAAVGRTMTFTLTAPLVTLATYAGQAAMGFDASMQNINSIAQLSTGQFKALKEAAFDFASTTRAGVVPATDALYEIFSAGITDTTTAMAVWQTATRVSEAGLADLSRTTNAVTATISAYGLQAEDAARVGDVWTHMVALGVGSLEDFLANSQKVLPLSSALGISFEDLGATIAFVSQQGGGAKKAMTAIAMLESNLIKPTEALKDAYAKLGVKTGQELIAKFGSLEGAIIAIRGAARDDIDFGAMFSKTGLEAALSITNNTDKATASIENFKDTVAGATDRAWEEQMKSFAAQFDLFKTSVQATAIAIGEQLLPMVTPFINSLKDAFLGLSKLNPEVIKFGLVVAGAVAAAGPILWLLGSFVTPIGLAIAGVAALAVAFETNFNNIGTDVKNTITGILGPEGLGKLENLYNLVVTTLFPEEQRQAAVDSIVPMEVGTSDVITVKAGDTLWDIFIANYSDQYTWEKFKEVVGLDNPGVLQVGDVIKIPGNIGQQFTQDITKAFAMGGGGDILSLTEEGGFLTEIYPKTDPLAASIIDRIGKAIAIVSASIGDELNPILTSITGWFDTNVGVG